MSDWRNNEDAGDLAMMGAADYSGHLGELEAEARGEAFDRYQVLFAKWAAADPTNPVYLKGIRCEGCDGPMDETNCHEGHAAWHCGCEVVA
ncbi:MAG: hypothetical protein ACYS0D_16555 [Planctomycetota bacterium]|jgi:hypothetical protein